MRTKLQSVSKRLFSRLDSAWNSWPVAVLLCLAGLYAADWAYRTTPAPGVSIGLLAAGAAIMTLRPQPMGFPEKLCWAVIISVFLVAEVHSIHNDRNKADAQATIDRQKQDYDFGKVLTTQNADFAQTAQGLEKSYKLSQDQFNATIKTLVKSHREDERSFAGVLNKQEMSFREQVDLSTELSGRLVPGNTPTPPNACTKDGSSMKPTQRVVILDSNAAISDRASSGVLAINNSVVVSFDKIEGTDSVALHIEMRDETGRILFRINKDGLVNPRGAFLVLRPDRSTLLLQNSYGQEFLRATLLNRQALVLSGNVVYCGTVVPMSPRFLTNSCSTNAGNALFGMTETVKCPIPQ